MFFFGCETQKAIAVTITHDTREKTRTQTMQGVQRP